MVRNIIFDWSGTLVDDLPAVWRASNHVFAQAGVAELTLDQFRSEFCLPFKGFYERYTPDVPLPQLEEWFHARFRQVQDDVIELPHARDFLEFCRAQKIRLFLLSTVHRDHFSTQASRTGFDIFFEKPYIEVWDKREKIHEILAENNLAPDETIFIGDMQHDIETARHGGILSCAVLTGYNHLDQLRAAEPDLIVEHLGELREILHRSKFILARRTHGQEPSPVSHPISTVGALIFDDAGRTLMIRTRKWSNLWGIPGGKIKYGETAVDALRREIKEETNLEISEIELVLVQDCIHSREFYREAHFVLLNYTCRVAGSADVRLNDEAQEFEWVPFDRAIEMKLNTPTLRLLEQVAKNQRPLGP
jgi:phosphoglycolate phosphatase-like HAD superfamily hydrolase/ADP-ribose pyrophosphatase YjhB (NUDIX family)